MRSLYERARTSRLARDAVLDTAYGLTENTVPQALVPPRYVVPEGMQYGLVPPEVIA